MEAEAADSLAAAQKKEVIDAAFGASKGPTGHRKRQATDDQHSNSAGTGEEEEQQHPATHHKHTKGGAKGEGGASQLMSSGAPWRGCTPPKKHKIFATPRCCLNDN